MKLSRVPLTQIFNELFCTMEFFFNINCFVGLCTALLKRLEKKKKKSMLWSLKTNLEKDTRNERALRLMKASEPTLLSKRAKSFRSAVRVFLSEPPSPVFLRATRIRKPVSLGQGHEHRAVERSVMNKPRSFTSLR